MFGCSFMILYNFTRNSHFSVINLCVRDARMNGRCSLLQWYHLWIVSKMFLRERFLRPFQTFFFLFLSLNQKRFFYCKSSKSQHELPLIYVFKIQGQYRVPLISECRLFAVSYCNAAHDWRISSVHHPNRSRGRDTLENHITVDVRSRRKGAAEKT